MKKQIEVTFVTEMRRANCATRQLLPRLVVGLQVGSGELQMVPRFDYGEEYNTDRFQMTPTTAQRLGSLFRQWISPVTFYEESRPLPFDSLTSLRYLHDPSRADPFRTSEPYLRITEAANPEALVPGDPYLVVTSNHSARGGFTALDSRYGLSVMSCPDNTAHYGKLAIVRASAYIGFTGGSAVERVRNFAAAS